jgi:hypothetical protein
MKNMDKELTVPKWVLIVQPKIPQMPQNLSAQFVYPSPKVLDFNEKRLHWVSIVCGLKDAILLKLKFHESKGQKSNAHCSWPCIHRKINKIVDPSNPLEPFTFSHFNMRHPVAILCSIFCMIINMHPNNFWYLTLLEKYFYLGLNKMVSIINIITALLQS